MYIECIVNGYILDVGTVLYMAGSLRYRKKIHPSFNVNSMQSKNKPFENFRRV